MNHLEETLEVVLSRGENLVLDNKVVKYLPTPLVRYLFGFWFSSPVSLILHFGSSTVSRAAVGSAVGRAEGWMLPALAAS